jgi:glycosyltransferase involved in cell wall biosynthesis
MKLGLQSRVKHIGDVEQADMPALYQLATAVVVPSLFESVSIPIYEAFNYGAPVCASAIQALPEQVGDAALLFDPNSAESIANAMRSLLKNRQLRETLSRRGSERIAALTHKRYAADLRRLVALLLQPSRQLA